MAKNSASLDLPSFVQPANTPPRAGHAKAQSTSSVSYPVEKSVAVEPAALPLLPRAKRPSFSSHRNDANAALALDLLADVQTAIVGWHQALRATLAEIQKLYTAGPIVDGWLEAVNRQATQADLDEHTAVLRHGDPEQVAAYIEKLAQQAQPAAQAHDSQYRLCSLNADGQIQCQACPPDELGAVSQAIARNQQLRQLVSQKQYLEAKLKRASEALDVTRKTLDIRGDSTSTEV